MLYRTSGWEECRQIHCWLLDSGPSAAETPRFSSSDSDFDDEEPRKFYVHIKPAPPRAVACSSEAAAAQLRATAGSLILPPGPGVRGGSWWATGTSWILLSLTLLDFLLFPQGTMKRHSSRE